MGDANEGKKRINWLAVRTYYLAGHQASECSKRYGVSVRQVQRRATEENWTDHRRANVAGATQDVVDELNRDTRTSHAKTMLTHIEYADRLMQIAIDGESDLAAIDPGRSRMEARKLLLEAADKAVRIAREVRGFKSGDSSLGDNEDENDKAPIEIRKTIITRPANDNLRELLG
jgi:hypothetical protein